MTRGSSRLAFLSVALAGLAGASCEGPTPRPEDVIVVAITNSPTNFDPAVGLDESSQKLHQLLFSSLVKIYASLRVVHPVVFARVFVRHK